MTLCSIREANCPEPFSMSPESSMAIKEIHVFPVVSYECVQSSSAGSEEREGLRTNKELQLREISLA